MPFPAARQQAGHFRKTRNRPGRTAQARQRTSISESYCRPFKTVRKTDSSFWLMSRGRVPFRQEIPGRKVVIFSAGKSTTSDGRRAFGVFREKSAEAASEWISSRGALRVRLRRVRPVPLPARLRIPSRGARPQSRRDLVPFLTLPCGFPAVPGADS